MSPIATKSYCMSWIVACRRAPEANFCRLRGAWFQWFLDGAIVGRLSSPAKVCLRGSSRLWYYFGMRTLREALADARTKKIALGHFNISDSNQFRAIKEAARA